MKEGKNKNKLNKKMFLLTEYITKNKNTKERKVNNVIK